MYKKFSHILLISPFNHFSFQLKSPLMTTAGGNFVSFAHFLLYFVLVSIIKILFAMESSKDVNGYSNIRTFVFHSNIGIQFLNSNIRIFFFPPVVLLSFKKKNYRPALKGG